jgi:hypothetical protein
MALILDEMEIASVKPHPNPLLGKERESAIAAFGD